MLFIAKDNCSSVSSDSYTGQVYYEKIGYNRWQMKFIVIRDIDAYMMVRLSVLAIINNYILL